MLVNLLTIDVEDWFHVLEAPAVADVARWDRLPSRVVGATRRLLDLFEAVGVRATCFVLGWVAERHPALVREIAARGFEVACHGWGHRLVHALTPQQFADDLARAVAAIEDAAGVRPRGFRAPGFSITARTPWAFDVLVEQGFTYDASVFPGRHGHGGFPAAHAAPFVVRTPGGAEIAEFPVATVRLVGRWATFGGGGYLRLLPAPVVAGAMRHLNARGVPATLYLHPRDADPDQPRIEGLSAWRRFKCYVNVGGTLPKLRWLLARFRFEAIGRFLDAPGVRSAMAHRIQEVA